MTDSSQKKSPALAATSAQANNLAENRTPTKFQSTASSGLSQAREKAKRRVYRSTRYTAFVIEYGDGATGTFLLPGRLAWALQRLILAGLDGCTPIEQPAPRWSEYVRALRHDYGLEIETIYEPHWGNYPGYHGRYVLRSRVRVMP